jgi:hypothetical protein
VELHVRQAVIHPAGQVGEVEVPTFLPLKGILFFFVVLFIVVILFASTTTYLLFRGCFSYKLFFVVSVTYITEPPFVFIVAVTIVVVLGMLSLV